MQFVSRIVKLHLPDIRHIFAAVIIVLFNTDSRQHRNTVFRIDHTADMSEVFCSPCAFYRIHTFFKRHKSDLLPCIRIKILPVNVMYPLFITSVRIRGIILSDRDDLVRKNIIDIFLQHSQSSRFKHICGYIRSVKQVKIHISVEIIFKAYPCTITGINSVIRRLGFILNDLCRAACQEQYSRQKKRYLFSHDFTPVQYTSASRQLSAELLFSLLFFSYR